MHTGDDAVTLDLSIKIGQPDDKNEPTGFVGIVHGRENQIFAVQQGRSALSQDQDALDSEKIRPTGVASGSLSRLPAGRTAMLMHIARLDPHSLEHLMLAVVNDPDSARMLLRMLGRSSN